MQREPKFAASGMFREPQPRQRVPLSIDALHKRIERHACIFGIILGVFLTIGFAYAYDASTKRPMVNWDVVSENWHGWSLQVRNTWHKLESTKI